MTSTKFSIFSLLTVTTVLLLIHAPPTLADGSTNGTPVFNDVADQALQAMKKRAEELDVKGVALVAYAEGGTVTSWTSKMVVVGHLTSMPDPNKKGSNLLGIAYTKAAEMADTLKDSGSKVRPPMNGEYGYQGGLVIKGKTGILIVAFSGGPSEDDLKVSHAGMEIMSNKL